MSLSRIPLSLVFLVILCLCIFHLPLVSMADETAGKPAPAFDWDDEDLDEPADYEDDEEAFGDEEGESLESVLSIPDPIEPVNRVFFVFNDKLYFWALKPVAVGYKAVTPELFRRGVKNVFHNLLFPVRFFGCVFQGKRTEAENETASFLVNSTFGVAGIFDLTSHIPEMNPPEEDLGQAMGAHGVGEGFYIVWPFLGPSTARDTAAFAGEYFLDPLFYLPTSGEILMAKGVNFVNQTTYRLGDYETLKGAAIDPYLAFRDGYIQYRRAQIAR